MDPQADCGSGQVMETKASTPDNASDTNTLVESPKTETVRSASSFQPDEIVENDTEIVMPCPTFVDPDDCELNRREFSESDSNENEIEAPFGYNDLKFCASVLFGYAKAHAELDAAVAG